MHLPGVNGERWAHFAKVFVISALLTLTWQWKGNAYQAEWSGDPDEPAHYVTGLMVHDYIAHGLFSSPMAYAKRYYDFYPKVALGHWPPLFYVIQSAWTLIFTPSRVALLLLLATLGALWLTAAFATINFLFPTWMAWASVVFLSATSDFQLSSRMVMAELPVAIFTLFALWSLARYLDRSGADWRDAAWFSVASLAAVLTKGTGIALAPLPLLGAVLGRKYRILRSLSFWLPILLVAVLAAVWFLGAPDALHQKVTTLGGFGLLRWYRIGDTLQHWMLSLGIFGSGLAAIGFLRKVWMVASGSEMSGLWTVTVIFLPVIVICRILFGPWEVRHLLTTLPLLMLCLCEGLSWILTIPRFRIAILGIAAAALAATAVRSVATTPPKVHLGLDRVAHDLLSNPGYDRDRFLILSDSVGEGVFIAEVASHETRPGHVVERGSKVLAEGSFGGDRIHLFFTTPEELMQFFEKTPERIVVLDGIQSSLPFIELVREAIRKYPGRWRHLATYPRAEAPLPIEVLCIQ
jgi:Dolichyl-phosphate-mannose-protein mannosyltransferase